MDVPKKILSELESMVEQRKIELGLQISDFDRAQWREDEYERSIARLHLYGGQSHQERIEVETWLYPRVDLSRTAKSDAMDHYELWEEFVNEEGVYSDFQPQDLLAPTGEDYLHKYILDLNAHVEEHGWGRKNQGRALRSFLSYLRKKNDPEEIAFLEHIFPAKMDINCDNRVYRLIRSQVYPIPEEMAGLIVRTLIEGALRGRPNAQLKIIEALAFCLLCLTVSRIRLPSREESIHSITRDKIVIEGERSYIFVPTFFGPYKVPVSKYVAEYLLAVASMTSSSSEGKIISSTLHDLRRSLRSAIKKAKISADYGEITFLTFMTQPHIFGKQIRPGRPPVANHKTVL